jgi:hypothetical protein
LGLQLQDGGKFHLKLNTGGLRSLLQFSTF